jgi:hypothetical protein
MSRKAEDKFYFGGESVQKAGRSRILGNLLDKNILPNGGWRALCDHDDLLIVSFEDPDIAEFVSKKLKKASIDHDGPTAAVGGHFHLEVRDESEED